MSILSKKSPPKVGIREEESRLARLRDGAGLFTSNLSVSEFALCSSIGVRPLGQVIGSTVYQMGWQSPPFASGELTYVMKAYLQARHLVFSRLQQQAEQLGADGVVGVRLTHTPLRQDGMIEWKATGTAAAIQGFQQSKKPFLSALSVQEFWALRQAGYAPVGLASGVCGYYQKGDCRFAPAALRSSYSMGAAQNQAYSTQDNREDTGLTAGVYAARSQAMRRLEREAASAGADGVVGIQWEMKTKRQEAGDLNETFRQDAYLSVAVLGTAIADSRYEPSSINYALPLVG